MPFPRSRLDAYLVFSDTTLQPDSLHIQFRQWCLKGYVSNEGYTGSHYAAFGFGLFQKLSVVHSVKSILFANNQGGYRVLCPNNDKIVTVDFTNGVAKWRALENTPQDNIVHCSGCDNEHRLVDFIGKPEFAFGRCAFHFTDIQYSVINEMILDEVDKNIGRGKLVLKRVG